MLYLIAGIFALLGLYNLYLFGKLRIRVILTSVDIFVFAFIIVMFVIYNFVFRPDLVKLLSIALSMVFWNYTGTIARGFDKKHVYTNKLNPFFNKKVDLKEIRSVSLSRAEGRLLAIVYFKESNVEDKQRFKLKDEKDLVKILKGNKIDVIN